MILLPELGTSKLVDPTLLTFNLTFISIDNVPECALLCQRPNLMTGISGSFAFRSNSSLVFHPCNKQFHFDGMFLAHISFSGSLKCISSSVDTTCTVQFQVNEVNRLLPTSFSFTLNFLNTHAHGMHFSVSGANFAGKNYGTSLSVRADPGKVLFGYNSGTVINIDLQPYIFNGQPDVNPSKAPLYAGGYLAIPNSVVKGPEMEAQAAWADAASIRNYAGAYVTINFQRQNVLAVFYLIEDQTLLSVFSQCVALGIAMVLYVTRTGLKIVEGWKQFSADLQAAALKSKEQNELEKGQRELKLQQKASVLTLEEVAQQTVALSIQVIEFFVLTRVLNILSRMFSCES